MEGALPNTSILPQKPSQTRAIRGLGTIVINTVLMGIFFGGALAAVAHISPYNRLVVFNQPTGTTVKLTSVKLSEPGLVTIYMQKSGGWEDVGWVRFDKPGYYRDVVVDIGYQQEIESLHKDNSSGNYEPRAFVARMERFTNADTAIDDVFVKEPVLDRRGQLYQKRFWWEEHGHPVKQFFIRLQDDPLGYLWDVIWP